MIAAPPASRRFPRTSAAQSVQRPPSSSARAGRFAMPPKRSEIRKRYSDDYEWAGVARHLARTVGVARFAQGITADTVSRVQPRVEVRDRDSGDWVPDTEQDWSGALEDYRNELEQPPELYRRHAWHYGVSGEMFSVVTQRQGSGVDWWLYSVEAVEPKNDGEPWVLRMQPGGSVEKGTAVRVDPSQITRLWIPDDDWLGLATSEMRASLEALRRLDKLSRFIRATLEQRTFAGAWWTPDEAHVQDVDDDAEDDEPAPSGDGRVSKLDADFVAVLEAANADDDERFGVIPLPIHTPGDKNVPRWVPIGRDLDPNTISHITQALEDFARGVNLPAALIIGGGPGDGNHWSDWLVDEKFFANAIAPRANRIFHYDMTRVWLPAHLRLRGLPEDGSRRVGYDPTPVIVRPDRTDHSLKLYLAGLLKGDRTLEEAGFSPDDMMGLDELTRLVAILSKAAPGGVPNDVGTAPVGPSNVVKAPPEPPPPGSPPPSSSNGHSPGSSPTPGQAPPMSAALKAPAKVLERVRSIRQALARKLLFGAEVAMANALKRVDVKVRTRARQRAAVGRAAVAALEAGEPLTAHLAAIGLAEEEALDGAFDQYESQAAKELRKARKAEARELERGGLDPDVVLGPEDDDRAGVAAGLLGAGLMAVARGRLAGGPTEQLGEVTGVVPARLVRDAVKVAEGSASGVLPESPDQLPTITDTVRDSIEDALVELEGDQPGSGVRWRWVHGYYGDPEKPFDGHLDLDQVEVDDKDDPQSDEATFEAEDWTDEATYQPGDHPGCTCEWEAIDAGSGELLAAGFASVSGNATA